MYVLYIVTAVALLVSLIASRRKTVAALKLAAKIKPIIGCKWLEKYGKDFPVEFDFLVNDFLEGDFL